MATMAIERNRRSANGRGRRRGRGRGLSRLCCIRKQRLVKIYVPESHIKKCSSTRVLVDETDRVVRRTAGGNASTPIGGVKSSSSIAIRITFPRGGNNIAAGAENDVGDGHGTWAFLLLLLTNTLQNSPNTNYSLEFSTVCTTYSTYAYGSATRTGLFNTLRQLDTY